MKNFFSKKAFKRFGLELLIALPIVLMVYGLIAIFGFQFSMIGLVSAVYLHRVMEKYDEAEELKEFEAWLEEESMDCEECPPCMPETKEKPPVQ